ncbi:MAG TPA: hypothetical protein VGF33_03065 [Caulobacteraceae bacterium]
MRSYRVEHIEGGGPMQAHICRSFDGYHLPDAERLADHWHQLEPGWECRVTALEDGHEVGSIRLLGALRRIVGKWP